MYGNVLQNPFLNSDPTGLSGKMGGGRKSRKSRSNSNCCEKHHPSPKAYKTHNRQFLVKMTKEQHLLVHRLMQTWMEKNCTKCTPVGEANAKFSNKNGGEQIRQFFTFDEILLCLSDFYSIFRHIFPKLHRYFQNNLRFSRSSPTSARIKSINTSGPPFGGSGIRSGNGVGGFR